MAVNDPWTRLRNAILDHDKMMQAHKDPSAGLPYLPDAIRRVAEAADDVTDATMRGEVGPQDHAFLMLHAMRVIGMTMVSRWIGLYSVQARPRPFTRMLDALPDVPAGPGSRKKKKR